MSAHDQVRAMLDELMGTSRDGRLFIANQYGFVLDLVRTLI